MNRQFARRSRCAVPALFKLVVVRPTVSLGFSALLHCPCPCEVKSLAVAELFVQLVDCVVITLILGEHGRHLDPFKLTTLALGLPLTRRSMCAAQRSSAARRSGSSSDLL